MKRLISLVVVCTLALCGLALAEDLRLESGVPVSCQELETVDSIQPLCLQFNPDGSISVKLECITFMDLVQLGLVEGKTYLRVRGTVNSPYAAGVYEGYMNWHKINRRTEEKLSCPILLKISGGVATFGPGKLGFAAQGTGEERALRLSLGLDVMNPLYMLSDEQLANIQIELDKLQ